MTMTNILVVEDEKIIAKGIEKRLKGLGYGVVALASSGAEAIQKATNLRPDIILMDIRLGDGMDGVEAARLIRQQLAVPVVFLTAYSDDATLQRAKLTEPFGYVLKPYEDKDLQISIEIGLYKHKMEQCLQENEAWLAATLASIGDGVIATNEQGQVRFLNSLAEDLTGWTQTAALGHDIREVFNIVGERTRQPVQNPALSAMAKGEGVTLSANTLLIDKGGAERPIEDSAAPVRDTNGKIVGAVLVFRDITERCRLEEHLRQAQKMEAIGRLAGGIAHDFNNIMTIIMGFSETLLLDSQTAVANHHALQAIHDAGKRAASLTQQIMAFSRKQILLPCVLNLNTVVHDIGLMVKQLIGPNIEFATDTAPDLGQVKADLTQIGQVVLNLAGNARDAMPKGGRLVIATSNVELTAETARQHPDRKPGWYALLSVSDTGSGMSEKVLSHVFEPFFTTKGVGEGTGLGLAIVYGIVKQSKGHIEVTSTVGQGTTFWVYLPLVEEPIPTPSRPETWLAMKGHETILLVEDEESVRKLATILLTRSGYTVLEASNGLEGVRMAEQYQGTIHLLITDLVMPKLSGRETADRLTALDPKLRVLFMSGYSEDMIGHEGMPFAEINFLQKPFSLIALTKKVREVLDRP